MQGALEVRLVQRGPPARRLWCGLGDAEGIWRPIICCCCADEAIAAGVPVAVCSTSNERAVSTIVRVMLGPEVAAKMRVFVSPAR